jgi:sulfonate transport system substrate-binding protein
VASSSFVDENPEITEKLLQASKEGVEYIDQNSEECYEYISNGTGWSVEDLNDLYPLLHITVNFTDDNITELKNTEQFLIDNDILEGEITNLESEHINTTYIERIGN